MLLNANDIELMQRSNTSHKEFVKLLQLNEAI